MQRTAATICGLLNLAFLGFHLLLATWIQRWPLAPDVRALMHAFNIGGMLMIGFLAFAFLFCRDALGTRLGRGAVVLGALVYLTRAAGELWLFPTPKVAILVSCALLGFLHLTLLGGKTDHR